MCFQTQPANFEECSRRSCQKSIVLENNRQKEWKKNSASNPISTLDQEQEESCIKSAENQKTTIEKRHRGENSRYEQFLKLYESASKNPNDSLRITEFHRAINSFAGLDRNIAYRDVINPTTLQPLTEKEKKILKTLFIKEATSDIGCVGYNSDDSGQNFNQIKDTNACQTYGEVASDYLYSDAFGENWGVRDTSGRFSEYGSSVPLPQNPEMEKLKKDLVYLV